MRVERFGPSVSRFDSFEGPMGSFLCDAWHSRHNLGTKYFRQSLTQKKGTQARIPPPLVEVWPNVLGFQTCPVDRGGGYQLYESSGIHSC